VFGLLVCPSVRASQTLLMQYLEKCWIYFHQTISIGVFWDKDERFQVLELKSTVRFNMLGNALFGLVNMIS